jgi:hypothetical protein
MRGRFFAAEKQIATILPKWRFRGVAMFRAQRDAGGKGCFRLRRAIGTPAPGCRDPAHDPSPADKLTPIGIGE